ncbi:MAG: regulatory protein RecX [Arenicellales bacterium]|nr:regulatory protein RecX [Arenicellales bacterium]
MDSDTRGYQRAWDRAIGLLSRREHSEKELRAKLLRRGGTQADTIARVIQDLKQRDYLSDQRFTDMFVQSRMERGDGPLKIRHELESRGIAESTINQYLNQPDQVWEKILFKVWSKKFGEMMPSDYKEWARQARFLHSRGFSSELIRKVVSFQD